MREKKARKLEEIIGYQFKHVSLLMQALTHSSYSNEHRLNKLESNERLEFLGDAVLELVSSEFLYKQFVQMSEGELSKKRASLVCEPTLALCAKDLNLGSFLCLGKGEDATGGRERNSILSDALEAVIGAIYLDGGLEVAKNFIMSFILNDIEHKELFYDSKTILQEMVQGYSKEKISYETVNVIGPEHNREFVMQVYIGGIACETGKGRTKQAAGQEAAYQTLMALKNGTIKI